MTQNLEELESTPPSAEPEGSRWARAHHVLLSFVVLAFIIWLLTGFYRVENGWVGLVERLGELDKNPVDAGLHYGWPWPLDIVHKIPASQALLTVKVTDFSTSGSANEELKKIYLRNGIPKEVLDAFFDPYLITADKNVLRCALAVQYKITDPHDYFLSVSHAMSHNSDEVLRERETIIGQVAAHALIREIARTPVNVALYGGRQNLEERLKKTIHKEAERIHLGIDVELVTVETLRWPTLVDDAFNSVTRSQAEAAAAITAARSFKESTITNANLGDASRILAEARGYSATIVAQAQGEAERFNQVYKQFAAAPDVTRSSLYGEAVNVVLTAAARALYVLPGQRMMLTLEPIDEKAKAVEQAQQPPR